MAFHPMMDQFKDFQQHIDHTEHLQAHKAGMAKISQLLHCLMMTSIHL